MNLTRRSRSAALPGSSRRPPAENLSDPYDKQKPRQSPGECPFRPMAEQNAASRQLGAMRELVIPCNVVAQSADRASCAGAPEEGRLDRPHLFPFGPSPYSQPNPPPAVPARPLSALWMAGAVTPTSRAASVIEV